MGWLNAMARTGLLLLLGLASAQGSPADTVRVRVVASFSILGDMVKAIGGDRVDVTVLVGPDADAHVYEPVPNDVRSINRASLLVVNGLGFEGWLDRLVEASGYAGAVVVASQGVAPLKVETGRHAEAVDPHAWQSLGNAGIYARNIALALIAYDTLRADEYRTALRIFLAEISQVDSWAKAEMATVPRERRKVITSHDAFGYFARDYAVDFLAPQGWTTEEQPTAARIARLIEQARQNRITALFVENISDPRLMEQLALEAGGVLGGKLYSDALSRAGGPADTYLKMFRHNVALLKARMERRPPISSRKR